MSEIAGSSASLFAGERTFAIGSTAARRFIEEFKPDACISGHIHESAGVDTIGPTTILNAGPFKDGGYIVVRAADGKLDARLEFL